MGDDLLYSLLDIYYYVYLFHINRLAFYHECRSLVGYGTIYSVVDSEWSSGVRVVNKMGVASLHFLGLRIGFRSSLNEL